MGEVLAGRRRWIGIAATVVVLALIGFGVLRALGAGAAEEPVAVATVTVNRGEVTTEVATTGSVQPAQTRSLSFAVKGTVESVSVRAGTTVTPGQVLARIDDTDAAEDVDTAQEALDEAEDALAEARSDSTATTSPTCGPNAAVAAYAEPTTTPTASASASAPVSPSPSASASASTSPAATGTTSPTRTPAPAKTTAPSRPGGSTTCQTGGQQGGGQQGGSDAVLSAEQRVTQATTTLQNAEDALAGTTITAPIAGRIISVSGKVGSQVTAGSTFVTLADVYDMQVNADFPEADADLLAVGQKAVVTLADRAGEEFPVTVVQVDPTGTSDGTMVRYGVLFSFDKAPKELLVGQSAPVRVTTGSKPDVLRVPSTAVHDVAGDSGTVLRDGAQVKVGIGLRGDQYTEVTSGLAEGDVVVRSW